MKKQILIFSALIIMAFFTACEQEPVINPADDITQLDTNTETTKLSPEEVEQFMELLESETTEDSIEERCDFPVSLWVMGPYSPELSLAWCDSRYRFIAHASNGPQDYYITIEQKRAGTYPIFDVFPFYHKTVVNWMSPYYSKDGSPTNIINECEITAKIYVQDRLCGGLRKVLDVPLQL